MTYSVDLHIDVGVDAVQVRRTVESASDYYPYGKALRSYGKERYQSTYHERDVESGFDYRGARFYDSDVGRFNSLDPLAAEFPEFSDYLYVVGNPLRFIDVDGRAPNDIILLGANNSSITIETDLIDVSVDASKFVGDLGGNHTLSGNDALITGLDIVGVVDPTPISDGLSATLSLEQGNYLGAGASFLGAAVPLLGDVAKIPKIAKGVNKIKNSIAVSKKSDDIVDVYRVYGGDSGPDRFSWTTINPNNVDNFRDAAGLPSGGASGANNTGRFVIEGQAKKADIIKERSALPLDGNKGGLPELIINPKNVDIKRVSGVNPEF